MATKFSAQDILNIAIKMESDGNKFYNKTAQLVASAETKKLLLELAQWEDSHEEFFCGLKEKLSLDNRELLCDVDGEAMKYLSALVGGSVFELEHELPQLSLNCDPKIVLQLAFGFEKETIAFFVGLLRFVKSDSAKLEILKVIDEEMRHVRVISEHLDKL